jgi:Immunity protein 21
LTQLFWLPNDAGPLLLLPEALLPDWSGIDVPDYREVSATFRWSSQEARASDYDRACDVNDYVAAIAVGHGEGLVLNDEPCATAWLPRPLGGLFARWEHADSARAMELALARIPGDLPWEPKGSVHLVGSPQELFNSAEPGVDPVLPRLKLEMPAGNYNVRWTLYRPDSSTAVGLIELRRAHE